MRTGEGGSARSDDDADYHAARRKRLVAQRAEQGLGPKCTDEALNDATAVILGMGLPPLPAAKPQRTRRAARSAD